MSFATCCVLSYGRPEMLADSLRSLVANAGEPFELIIHDDGSARSEDGRYDVYSALSWAHATYGATVILNPPGHNQGVGVAVNRMFAMAAGDTLIKLDADLEYRPGWLTKVRQILADNQAAVAEPLIGTMGLFEYHHEPVVHEKMLIRVRRNWQQVEDYVGSAVAMSRRVWDVLGPFEEHSDAFAEDVDFKRRAREYGLVHALPLDDLAVNVGFGLGKSTVVVAGELGQPTVAKIHHGPRLVTP